MSDDRSTDAADWHGLLEELRRWLPAIPEEHADWAAAQIIRLLYRRFGEQRMSEAIAGETKKRLGRPKEDDQLYVNEILRIVAGDGSSDSLNRKISKASKQVSALVPRAKEKNRKDIAKTLRYKAKNTVSTYENQIMGKAVAKTITLGIEINYQLERWAEHPEMLAKIEVLRDEFVVHRDTLLAALRASGSSGPSRPTA
jgi:hypothetical protein